MCQVIRKPGDFEIPFDKLKSSCLVNPDGFGIMGNDRGKLVFKTHFSGDNDPEHVAKVLEEYKSLDEIFLHLRFRTKGKTDALSCHPFKIYSDGGRQLMLMHNGTLSGYGNEDTVDSLDFGLKLVGPLYERMLSYCDDPLGDPLFQEIVKKYTGVSSKIVLLDNKGDHIVNYDQGEEITEKDTGLIWWVSNTYSFDRYHREPTTTYSRTTYSPPARTYSFHSNKKVEEKKEEKEEPKFEFPRQEVRDSFLDYLDPGINLEDLCDLTYEDVSDIVDWHPDLAKLLICDLLLELAYE